MHDLGLHYHETSNKYLVFLKTVFKSKEGFIKKQINIPVIAWELQHTLVFLTSK